MLYFIPAWYQQDRWCENEQYWHARRMKTEFDDTVKHIQLFHRSQAHPFRIMLLSFAPNFRHFLHRQSVFHAPYWSCFDAIQEVRRKKIVMFSVRNIKWPEHIEFIYTPFVLVAQLNGKRYAQIEFGEDGNLIQIDMYEEDVISRRNIYDDRGFISSTIVFERGEQRYQDYLTDKGIWKLRQFFDDGHIEVNKKIPTYLLEYEGQEFSRVFEKNRYDSMEEIIGEVLSAYLELTDKNDLFCIAMHRLHADLLYRVLDGRKKLLSFFGNRCEQEYLEKHRYMIETANYIITDSQENLSAIKRLTAKEINIEDITPFDSRVDFGISQQLSVQKILVPVDGMEEERFGKVIRRLGEYLPTNPNACVHLFTRVADYDRKSVLLERTRICLREAGMEEEWAAEGTASIAENMLDTSETVPTKFFVEQCVDELAVSKCMREQRLILDLRVQAELYLQIAAISMGIPQIVCRETPFVEHSKNGLQIKSSKRIPEAVHYYLDNLTNWNEAVVHSYEIGKRYTTKVLIEKWKEVIDFVGQD